MTTDADFARANKRGAKMMKRGPIVVFVAYDPASRTLLLTFADGTTMTTPVDNVQGLAEADDADLAEIEIASLGLGLHWPRLNADVWVPTLVEGITGTQAWRAARRNANLMAAIADLDAGNGIEMVWENGELVPASEA